MTGAGPNDFDAGAGDINEQTRRRAEFSETLSQNGYPDTLVLGRDRMSIFSRDQRLTLIDRLQDHGPISMQDLVETMDCSGSVVQGDLFALATIDVVEVVYEGDTKIVQLAHDHIVIEPIV